MAKPNKYDLKEVFKHKLQEYTSTFKETSYGGEQGKEKSLCEDDSVEVFDIDTYLKNNCEEYNIERSSLPARPDAIYFHNDGVKIYFVEFKSGNNIQSSELKKKMTSGVKVFRQIIGVAIDSKYKFIYCVVEENSMNEQKARQVKNRKPKYNLEDINKNDCNGFYSEIVTKPIDFYKKNFKELQC